MPEKKRRHKNGTRVHLNNGTPSGPEQKKRVPGDGDALGCQPLCDVPEEDGRHIPHLRLGQWLEHHNLVLSATLFRSPLALLFCCFVLPINPFSKIKLTLS